MTSLYGISGRRSDALFEGLRLSAKETVAGYAMLVYLNDVGRATAVRLMDKIVNVKVISYEGGAPLDSSIDCAELRVLMHLSLGYTKRVMDVDWRHSEAEAAKALRSAVMDWFGTADVEQLIANMEPDFCAFVVRLSRWVRE